MTMFSLVVLDMTLNFLFFFNSISLQALMQFTCEGEPNGNRMGAIRAIEELQKSQIGKGDLALYNNHSLVLMNK